MLGAAVGDIVGSVYELCPIKEKDFPFFGEGCTFTDDTVCTVAVIESLVDGVDIGESLRMWGRKYPHCGYGAFFVRWLFDESLGSYGSLGNGAAMRISPVGLLACTESDVISLADSVTLVTHNHPEALTGARATAMAIFWARCGHTRQFIRERIGGEFDYDLSRHVEDIRSCYTFDVTCRGTVPVALICALEAEDFEDAIRNAISLGGDSDTLAAIAGPLAEVLYGIPREIRDTVRDLLDPPLLSLFDRLYTHVIYREEIF